MVLFCKLSNRGGETHMKQDKNERLTCIYQKMYPIMYRVACRLSGSVETAENLTHDAFSLALSRQDVFFTHPNPEGWLMVTLTHLIKNERKKRSLYIYQPRRNRPPFGTCCRRTCPKRTNSF